MFAKESGYTLRTEEAEGTVRYIAAFQDGQNLLQEVEVPHSVFAALADCSKKENALARQDRRRIEQCDLTDIELYDRAFRKPKSVEEEVAENLRNEVLEQAIADLPETMRRRFLLYRDCGLTYEWIAQMEGRNVKSIFESIRAAEEKIREKMKNL